METALLVYGCLLTLGVYLVSRRYRSIVNPVAYFAAFYSLQTAVTPALFDLLGLHGDASESAELATIGYSALYFTAIAVPFLIRASPLLRPLILAKNTLLPREPRSSPVGYAALAAQFLLLFAVLIVMSGTTDWFTAPRTAYQLHRAGVGLWWALCQGALMTLLIAFLARGRRTALVTLAACVTVSFGAYFLGSKSYMLFSLVLAIFYYEHAVKPIPRWAILAAILVTLIAISALQLLQGTADSVTDTVAYFDYFRNTATFLDEFVGRFHHTWGATWLSSFWQYVPRALYPDKPFAYGIGAIMENFQPGAAEQGSTAGILPWAAAYLDFGWSGVVLEGLVTGFIAKAVFELMRARMSVASLLLFAQLGLQTAQPVYSAPLPLFWIWLAVEIAVLKVADGAHIELLRFARVRGLTRNHRSALIQNRLSIDFQD